MRIQSNDIFILKWLGAMNIRKVVETHTSDVSKKSRVTEIREFDKKLEKLLLTDENQNQSQKE